MNIDETNLFAFVYIKIWEINSHYSSKVAESLFLNTFVHYEIEVSSFNDVF